MNPMEFTLNPNTNFLTTVNVKPRDLFRIEDTWFLAIKDDKDYFDDFHGLNAIELPCCGYRAFFCRFFSSIIITSDMYIIDRQRLQRVAILHNLGRACYIGSPRTFNQQFVVLIVVDNIVAVQFLNAHGIYLSFIFYIYYSISFCFCQDSKNKKIKRRYKG